MEPTQNLKADTVETEGRKSRPLLSVHNILRVVQKTLSGVRFIVQYYMSSGEFDSQRGTHTSGLIPSRLLLFGNPLSRHAVRYQACSVPRFRVVMAALDIPFAEFIFVDLGCGKGRPLIIAKELGFKKLIGVELSRRLCEICRSNCPAAHVIQGDAGEFEFPEGKIVVFMFNPFSGLVMKRVAANLLRHRGTCFVVYVNPKHRQVFDSEPRFHLSYFDGSHGIWLVAGSSFEIL